MNLILTNPAGLWALLGIPAVLAIHLLQRQPRQVLNSTLFLLNHTQTENRAGQRIERLRTSIPLWLQLLIVLLVTWLLVNPRWQRNNSVQRTAIVIDSSASMQAFKSQLLTKLPAILAQLSSPAKREEFIILDSTLHSEPLYHGNSTAALLAQLSDWQPLQGAHDFGPALEVAHSLVGASGSILLITDHTVEDLPFNTQLLAIGENIVNVGFTGFRLIKIDSPPTLTWRALVKNYSTSPQQRQWTIQIGNQSQPSKTLNLAPGQTLTLSGTFPDDLDRFTLTLTPDTFTLDDQLPVQRPLAKSLTFSHSSQPDDGSLITKVLASLPNTSAVIPTGEATTDLVIASYNPLSPATPDQPAIIAIRDPLGIGKALSGQIVASRHALTKGLMWHGLVARATLQIPTRETDEVLLWQGKRPMIWQRKINTTRQLIFNFDLTASNVARLPAFVVMISRFIEQIRKDKLTLTRINAETNQPLSVAIRPNNTDSLTLRWQSDLGEGIKTILPIHLATLRAPQAPGYFQISQGDSAIPLMSGATFFADTREADFSKSISRDTLVKLTPSLVQQHTRSDPYWRVWIILAGLVLILNWHFTSRTTP